MGGILEEVKYEGSIVYQKNEMSTDSAKLLQAPQKKKKTGLAGCDFFQRKQEGKVVPEEEVDGRRVRGSQTTPQKKIYKPAVKGEDWQAGECCQTLKTRVSIVEKEVWGRTMGPLVGRMYQLKLRGF